MDMKRRVLIYFFISMLVIRKKNHGKEEEWGSYKMKVII
jgi:hypothetical protein